MNHPEIKLPDNPREALEQIASYLVTVRAGPDRKHYESTGPEGLGREFVGYWQTPEWIAGLAQVTAEAQRVAALANDEAKRLLQALGIINNMAGMCTGAFRVRLNDYLSVNGLKRLPLVNSGEKEQKENEAELLARLEKLP